MPDFSAFVGGSYQAQSPVSDNEELINWFVEVSESPGATAQASLYPTPGVDPFVIVPHAPSGGRAMISVQSTSQGPVPARERCFVVVGDGFYELFADSQPLLRGNVLVDEHPATISTNGYGSDDTSGAGQLLITSGGRVYCYELSTDALVEQFVLSGDGIHATQGACVNGYFLVFDRDRGTIYMSFLLDGSRWDLSDFFQPAITNPWQAMCVSPFGQIVLPGVTTGEIWYNAGTFPIPFAPDLSGAMSYGCVATFSIAVVGDSVMWVAKGPDGGIQVVQLRGYRVERISTHAMEFEGAAYPRLDDAIGQAYTEQGHTFYLLTFPAANVTWCYDEKAPEGRRWHKRGTWLSEKGQYHYWRPVFHCFAFNKHLMADRESTAVYHMSSRLPRDIDGRVIRRLRRSPTLQNEDQLVIFNWFELLLQTGIGQDPAPHGKPPMVMLRISKDGGRTWGDERQAYAGSLGFYQTRVYWPRIGQARQRVFEVTVSDPVRNWRVTAAYLRVPPGQEG